MQGRRLTWRAWRDGTQRTRRGARVEQIPRSADAARAAASRRLPRLNGLPPAPGSSDCAASVKKAEPPLDQVGRAGTGRGMRAHKRMRDFLQHIGPCAERRVANDPSDAIRTRDLSDRNARFGGGDRGRTRSHVLPRHERHQLDGSHDAAGLRQRPVPHSRRAELRYQPGSDLRAHRDARGTRLSHHEWPAGPDLGSSRYWRGSDHRLQVHGALTGRGRDSRPTPLAANQIDAGVDGDSRRRVQIAGIPHLSRGSVDASGRSELDGQRRRIPASQSLLIHGEAHLRRAVHEYVAHYHGERNHQGIDDRIIDSSTIGSQRSGPIGYRERPVLRFYQCARRARRCFGTLPEYRHGRISRTDRCSSPPSTTAA